MTEFLGLDAKGLGQIDNAGDLLAQQLTLLLQLAAGHMIGNERPVAMPPLQKPFGGEPFVDAENRILVDG